MEKYAYRSDLPKPASFGGVNFESPIISVVMKIGTKFVKAAAKKYQPKSGVTRTIIQLPMEDGEKIDCFLVEPTGTEEDLPVVMYYHGGAFIFPIQQMMIQNAEYYARELHCRVFVPEYRLAPKYPFPIPLEDCYRTLTYVSEQKKRFHIDDKKLILYGDSAGGCLAAAIAQMCRDRKGPRALGQMLIYPVTSHLSNTGSMEEYKDAVWSRKVNKNMWNMYLKEGDKGMLKYAAPLFSDNFSDLPRAYVEPQEMDSLRDEAIEYEKKLREAGIQTELKIIPGSYHGFDTDLCNEFIREIVDYRCQVMKQMLEK